MPSSTKSVHAIEFQQVTKYYGQTLALHNFSLSLPSHAIIGLVGPNGAGKSTLLKLLAGLLQPNSGAIRVLNLDMSRRPLQIRALTGYLSQNQHFDRWMQVRQVVELSAQLSGASLVNVEKTLIQCGLSNLSSRQVDTLSGGEKQRLGIAAAVVHQPSLVILDEPAASLDPRGQHDMLELTRSLKQAGRTIIFSSHILTDVERISDYLVVMDHGRIVKAGSRQSVLRSKDLETVFLGVTS